MEFKNIILISLIVVITATDPEESLNDLITEAEQKDTKVLTRRRRFLTFPDGSSFQLVFCTQNHGYLQVGDIVWFGNTAALAWELPSDPTLFQYFKKYERDPALRRQDTQHIIYLDEDGKVLSAVPYKRRKKLIVNPAFAKRSIEEEADMKNVVRKMHESHININYFADMDANNIEFHRNGRKSLYESLNTFFEALGWRGKDCVLRMLCESANANKNAQGTFLEEIFRVTFTLPRSRLDLQEYDEAHQKMDCEKKYSQCEDIHGASMFSDS